MPIDNEPSRVLLRDSAVSSPLASCSWSASAAARIFGCPPSLLATASWAPVILSQGPSFARSSSLMSRPAPRALFRFSGFNSPLSIFSCRASTTASIFGCPDRRLATASWPSFASSSLLDDKPSANVVLRLSGVKSPLASFVCTASTAARNFGCPDSVLARASGTWAKPCFVSSSLPIDTRPSCTVSLRLSRERSPAAIFFCRVSTTANILG